jgi:hypothetical protein
MANIVVTKKTVTQLNRSVGFVAQFNAIINTNPHPTTGQIWPRPSV